MRPPRLPRPISSRCAGPCCWQCGIALVLALVVSVQVYLSMLAHGHSFIRLFAWQLGSWGFWALVAPRVLRVGGGLTKSRSIQGGLFRAAALGIVLTAVHMSLDAAFAVWLRPFYPLPTAGFRGRVPQRDAVALRH